MHNPPGTTTEPAGPLARFFAHPYLLLVLAPTFWGGNLVAGKLAVGQIDPFLLLVGRWTGAALILVTIALPRVYRDWSRIRPALFWLAVYGVLGFAGFNVLMYNAARFTAAVNASIEQATISVLVLLGNFIVFGVRARPLQVAGLILTVIGVVTVATHGEPGQLLDLSVNVGDAMVLLACVLYALYSLTLKYRPAIHWLSFIFMTAGFAFLASLVFVFAFGGGAGMIARSLPETTLLGWACVAYVMLFPSIIAQLCYARGVQLIGPNRAAIFINLLPITGTILSVIIIGERLETYHLLAAALVVIGIAMAEWAVLRRTGRQVGR